GIPLLYYGDEIALPGGNDAPISEREAPAGNGEDPATPVDPPRAMAGGGDSETKKAPPTGEQPAAPEETPESRPSEAVVQSDNRTRPSPKKAHDDPLEPSSPEESEPPQLVRASPPEAAAPDAAPVVERPIPELDIDYSPGSVRKNVHVFRFAAARDAIRSRAFDEVLEREGLSFSAVGAASERGSPLTAASRPVPEIDVIVARGYPVHVHRILGVLRERTDEFRPIAVYPLPRARVLDWVIAIAEDLPPIPETQPPGATPELNLNSLSSGSSALSDYMQLSSDPTIEAFAWRAPPADAKLVDRFFPIPEEPSPLRDDRKRHDQVNPDLKVEMMFILVPRQ
ncbi:MAG: hypothetical protein KY475_11775, partial [Planctomycetes bacterium]|nr:hypothetical protein [Planctomycetota bacterium]